MLATKSVVWSAFRAGSLRAVQLRPSVHARSGAVCVCSFRSATAAGQFARRWALRLGLSVAVRRSAGLWAVSVPVRRSSSRWPVSVGRVLSVAGGIRAVARVLAFSGLGVW